MAGKFITLEGLDGAGKSTQLTWIREYVERRGVATCVTREPGGTELGEALRTLLLDSTQHFNPETEALLMFAARREHIDKVIAPALSRGEWVICDRFTDATFAYQAGGSRVDWQKIAALEAWVQGSLQPDVTFYFDISPERAKRRTDAARASDRYEQEQAAFHERTRAAYLRRSQEHPQRIVVIDAAGTIAQVQAALEPVLERMTSPAR